MNYASMVTFAERGLLPQPREGCSGGLMNVDGLVVGGSCARPSPCGGRSPQTLFIRRHVPYVTNGAWVGTNLQSLRELVSDSTTLNLEALRNAM
jgi:hypothetical protein